MNLRNRTNSSRNRSAKVYVNDVEEELQVDQRVLS
jgi:hypothetical protein